MSTIIAVASGKGGVGKTLITASLAVALQRRGHTVLAVDADMGLRNLDLMFGMQDDVLFDIGDAVKGSCRPEEAIISIVGGLDFLAASQKHTWEKIDAPSYHYILETLSKEYDYTVIDCPPGRGRAFKDAAVIADRTFFVVEPTWSSMRDAARVMQYFNKHKRFNYDVLFNNFYGRDPGYVSVQEMLQLLSPETIAGILPHDPDIHAFAQKGTLIHAPASIPFFMAMEETMVYIETKESPHIDGLLTLLPEKETSLLGYSPELPQNNFQSDGIMKGLAAAELQKAAAILRGVSFPDKEETGEKTPIPPQISLRQRRQQSMSWRHYRR
ncbi:MAG: AAA family ATPase [Megasphaera cerevisiae]|jgi:septum site-determining protein MinD|nr:AAA family ATPase [Megasphaera cerevisiae]